VYPTDEFRRAYGTISGMVLLPDGRTPFQGAYVVARSVDQPRRDAVGGSSGALVRSNSSSPGARRGRFDLVGLPPGHYTVEIEQIIRTYGVGPVSPPVTLPGPAEFWNGTDEASTTPPDDPRAFATLTVEAGRELGDIDLIINAPSSVPANDTCEQAREIGGLPFADILDTRFATVDRVRCPDVTVASHVVWYRYTAAADGVVTVRTTGSSYPTQIAALADRCGDFHVANGACTLAAAGSLSLSLGAGESVRLAIADRDFSGAGELHLTVATADLTPCVADCDGLGTVGINELIVAVNIALGLVPLDMCAAAASDGHVDIADLIAAVNSALDGCTPPAG
jgi:hypothetical protein